MAVRSWFKVEYRWKIWRRVIKHDIISKEMPKCEHDNRLDDGDLGYRLRQTARDTKPWEQVYFADKWWVILYNL